MKVSFLTFASSNWTKSPVRYAEYEKYIRENYNFFDKFMIWNEKNLNEEYQKRFSPYYGDHGYAYFSWKPYCIKQALESIDDGDYLLYLDSGCNLPMDENMGKFLSDLKNEIERDEADGSGLSLTTYIDKNLEINIPNACIIRKQILDKVGLTDNIRFLFKFPHYQAGLVLIKKTEENLKFVQNWYDFFDENYETCIRSDYRDKTGQWKHFLQNGSDQAILQCLLYIYNKKVNIMNFFYEYNIIAHNLG